MTRAAIRVCRGDVKVFIPWRTLLISSLALGFYLALGPAPEGWVYDRVAVEQGEFWRLVTGHWVHSDPEHATWNIAALAVMGLLFERNLKGAVFGTLAVGMVGVDVWLWWGGTAPDLYCGLSGALNAMLIAGLAVLWRERRHPMIVLVAVACVAKVLVELTLGEALLTQTAWSSVPAAHVGGLLAGGMFLLSPRRLPR